MATKTWLHLDGTDYELQRTFASETDVDFTKMRDYLLDHLTGGSSSRGAANNPPKTLEVLVLLGGQATELTVVADNVSRVAVYVTAQNQAPVKKLY